MQNNHASMRSVSVSWLAALLLSACATAPYAPAALESVPFQDRAQTQMNGPVTVSAAVPGPQETRALFDLPLYDSGIQPVWIEVRNGTDSRMRYAPVGTDPDYFSPQEVAYVHKSGFSKQGKVEMNRYFYDMGMPRRIPPGESRSGFVFTHARPGTKAFNVDLFGASRDNDVSFTFFIDVPGFAPDHSDAYFEELYSADQIRELDRAEIRSELATMDFFTRDRSGQQQGLPINLIVIGEPLEVLQALIRANWVETPRTEAEIASTTEYFFDRPADVVFTTNRDASGERNELRFWLSPMRAEGLPVWFAQVMHHIGQGKGRTQLDPDLDDAATFFLQDLWYGQGLARFGWVQGQGEVAFENSRRTFAGSEYFTGGNLAVMWLTGETVSMLDVDILDWDVGPVKGGP
ncbi:MAG: LssY C-terminal domain-containing protein [Gammaproteobacteria bacterium]|nr:LssY C-terminal domain-containing protein [Gammaproteobacteria bacterium]